MISEDFDFVPEWGSSNPAPSRTIKQAYFPVSISATVREATFSETLTGILGADPSHDVPDLKAAFFDRSELQGDDQTAEELWNAFITSYGVSAEGFGASDPDTDPDYIIPFHKDIATTIKIGQRSWWRLYWLLMTDPDDGVDEDLHARFVEALFDTPPSNLLEQLVLKAIEDMRDTPYDPDPKQAVESHEFNETPPLVPGCAEAFRNDIRAWLELQPSESSSSWMQGLRDIINYHYMMYVIQVAVTLQDEYEHVESQAGPPYEYTFELTPIPFGLASERASQSRDFVKVWKENGISRALYDSWGRLAVMRHIVEVGTDADSPVADGPFTLTEALNEFPEDLQQEVVDQLLSEYPEEQRPDGEYELAEVALNFAHTVRRYYENMGRTPSAQTAYSAGENSVRDLGQGTDRQYIERRQGVGTILRLDRGSLRLFARLFDATRERGHIDEFWEYMRQRGIQFDRRSKQELIDQLEGMGLLQRQSDSGEAMYVETI